MSTNVRQPVTVLVLTYNEERNLPACLESVAGWGAEIVVVDSGSTDATVSIARQYGARVVTHPFETHAKQWSWALANVAISGEWVLALDADQRVTPELGREIADVLATGPEELSGFYVNRRQIFRGKWIRHGGYYPRYLLKLFRRGMARVDERDFVDHHFLISGTAGKLRHDIVEDNQNEADISTWVAKHNLYAILQAREEVERAHMESNASARLLGSPDERRLWVKRNVWARLPLFLRPLLYFLYRYFLRNGFLDGREGFLFHFLQAYWYRLLVDVHVTDLRRPSKGAAATGRRG